LITRLIFIHCLIVRIALVGKGGSGKTTLAALLARRLAAHADPVTPRLLAVDADINQHLAVAVGASPRQAAALPSLAAVAGIVKEYLWGDNPRIATAADMVKTTPPGRGSRLLRLGQPSPVWDAAVRVVNGVPLLATGELVADDADERRIGTACYHAKTGTVELVLNHLVDGPGEYVVVDMTAGADAFASGLFTRFDLTVVVCEPTLRSVGVWEQYTRYARDFDVRVAVVGNKVEDDEDVAFLRDHVGADLVAWLGRSAVVRAAERGENRPLEDLAASDLAALDTLIARLDDCRRDWRRYTAQSHDLHRRNAASWADERTGRDLAAQIDPEFDLELAARGALA
jgi:CO dehydrogenase maturation factor